MGHTQLQNSAHIFGQVELGLSGFSALSKKTGDDTCTLDALVDGVHCAGCIQKIESRLLREPDVKSARVNFSTRRLNIVWSGDVTRADELAGFVAALGYGVRPYSNERANKSTQDELRFLIQCIAVSGFAMSNIMFLSYILWTVPQGDMGIATRDFLNWLCALIALPSVLFSGLPFYRSAFRALSNGHTNMDVPITVGIFLSCIVSVMETFRHAEHVYYDSAVMLIFFLLLGRYFDLRARAHARAVATDLLDTFTGFARVMTDSGVTNIPIRDVREDMVVSVAMGEKFPVDGVIVTGVTDVDTSLVTGESLPRKAEPGTEVYAGTMNIMAPVILRVARAADNSILSDIVRLMEKAGQGQARYVRLAERVARLYTPVVHITALVSFIGWMMVNADWHHALIIASTVLIITCPCALGLAVPVVQVLATGVLMKRGILVKSGDALERLATVDTVLLDKTGTLTYGRPVLENKQDISLPVLRLAASVAAHSTHPLSRAIASAYMGDLVSVEGITEYPGQGSAGYVADVPIRLGSRAWCGDISASPPEGLEVWVRIGDDPAVPFKFHDALRDDAAQTINGFKIRGLTPILVSGDRRENVERVARELSIDVFYADLFPKDKVAVMDDLKSKGAKTLMVGDGLNDAPVLAGADVSIAPGTAIDMAQNAADIVFMKDEFASVLVAYDTAVRTQKLVRQNFWLATLYNIVAVPAAIAGVVTPMIAALAMSSSSLVVIANAFRLKWSRKS